MYLFLYLYVFLLKFIYFFLKLFPIKNKIVFVSRQSDKPSLDLLMLAKKINELDKDVKVVFVTKRATKNVVAILKSSIILLRQMYHMATSKVCITDGYNIAVSVLNHKKRLIIVQLWHSLGAIKKFGYQTLYSSRDKRIAEIMKMHKNYDYVNGCSKGMIKYYSKVFGYEEDKLYPFGLPRVNYLISNYDSMKDKVYSIYPKLKNKKIILYIPTFRDNDNYKINELISSIDLEKYVLIIKKHPRMNVQIDPQDGLYICNEFNSFSLLPVADYIITDYSGMMIEAAAIDKPIYLYVYDLDDYKNNPGINMNLENEFKGYVFKDASDLYNCLDSQKYNYSLLEKFKNKYVVSIKGDITDNIANFILEKGVYNSESKN